MHERFPMCSTFKLLLASAVLTRKDRGKEDLARKVVYTQAQVVSYSPLSGPRAGGEGMTVAELCEAALTRSDNTAANLLLESIGGPPALTAFARGIGDPLTRLDRNETTLNEAIPGDPRDTTTPAAMLADMRALLLGERLSAGSREQLIAWLVANKTGDARLRAGLPKDWRVGDKTGTGDRGTANDIAIIWPAGRAPLLVTTYLTGATHASPAQRDAAIAKVGAWVAKI
jgi:beta-lactamase class A